MSEINEQDQAEEDEDCGANNGDIVAPEDEETVRNEEGDDGEDKPEQDLGTPPAARGVSSMIRGL